MGARVKVMIPDPIVLNDPRPKQHQIVIQGHLTWMKERCPEDYDRLMQCMQMFYGEWQKVYSALEAGDKYRGYMRISDPLRHIRDAMSRCSEINDRIAQVKCRKLQGIRKLAAWLSLKHRHELHARIDKWVNRCMKN